MKICSHKNCLDEYIGLIAITISIMFYIIQFAYTSDTFNVSSFSVYAIILGIISEALYCVQGYYKNSPTIMLTRSMTTVGFSYILFIWIYDRYKKNKSKNQ